jgi:CspA family cold shock protein
MARESGVVKWFSNEKGYGFLSRESGGDVFVHHSDIEGQGFKTLRAGQKVDFEVKSTDRGLRAFGLEMPEGTGSSERPRRRGARSPSGSADSAGPAQSWRARVWEKLGLSAGRP